MISGRVPGRSREFQDYLSRLPLHERREIEEAETAYVRELPTRLWPTEWAVAQQMVGFEEPPAGPRYRQPWREIARA